MSGKATLKSFKTLLGEARLPERTIPVCLRADLVADHEAADRELEALLKQPAAKFSGDGRGELRTRIQALEAEMAEATYDFRLRAMSKPRFRQLIADHPPRRVEGNAIDDRDKVLGVNGETFFDALIRACLVDPELTDEEWAALNEALTDRQHGDLADAAWYLNRGEIDVPFSRAASRTNPSSEPA